MSTCYDVKRPSITTKDKLQFALSLGRHTKATVRQVEMLLRYAQALKQLGTLERVMTEKEIAKRHRIADRIGRIVGEISGAETRGWGVVVDDGSGTPRLTIRVPSGEEIVCPA